MHRDSECQPFRNTKPLLGQHLTTGLHKAPSEWLTAGPNAKPACKDDPSGEGSTATERLARKVGVGPRQSPKARPERAQAWSDLGDTHTLGVDRVPPACQALS